MGRFNYVRYDEKSVTLQERAKATCEDLETQINALGAGRAQDFAMAKLEECYMWIGKAIRDKQVERGSTTGHVQERGDD